MEQFGELEVLHLMNKISEKLGLNENQTIIGYIYIGTPKGKKKSLPEMNTDDYISIWELNSLMNKKVFFIPLSASFPIFCCLSFISSNRELPFCRARL